MTYETVAAISQSAVLIFYILFFIAVLVYVFWPGNKTRFERASRSALDLDGSAKDPGDDNK